MKMIYSRKRLKMSNDRIKQDMREMKLGMNVTPIRKGSVPPTRVCKCGEGYDNSWAICYDMKQNRGEIPDAGDS